MDIEDINHFPPEKMVIVTTGSQGEPMSTLTRMATADHRWVSIQPGDTVIISPPLYRAMKTGSPHRGSALPAGCGGYLRSAWGFMFPATSQEELKILLNLIKPKYFVPVHGEYRHLMTHAKLAEDLGITRSSIFVMENGQILELDEREAQVTGKVASGKILVDGLGSAMSAISYCAIAGSWRRTV